MVCSVSSLTIPRPKMKRVRHLSRPRRRILSAERFSAGKPKASPTAVPSNSPAKRSFALIGLMLNRIFCHHGRLAQAGKFLNAAVYIAVACELADPAGWNQFYSVGDAGQTTGDATGGVGVATEIDGFEDTVAKILRGEQAPETRMQSVEHITAGNNFCFR